MRTRSSCIHLNHELTSFLRLLHAIFIFCNLITTTYGISPALSVLQDGDVELPCEEMLWNAPTADVWQQCVVQAKEQKKLSLLEGVSRLMNSYGPSETPSEDLIWSPFTAVLILHAVSVQFWHLSQHTALYQSTALPTATNEALSVLQNQNATVLARCHVHISRARDSRNHLWGEAEGPLLFNSLSILRLIYLRAFNGVNSIDRSILLRSSAFQATEALQAFISAPQTRNHFITKVAGQVLDGIMTGSRVGRRLVQKTAALTWSLEIAISGWDSGKDDSVIFDDPFHRACPPSFLPPTPPPPPKSATKRAKLKKTAQH